MKGLICNNLIKLSHGGGGNSSFQPLKRFTLFSCSSLIFTGLLTVDLNAQDITITNANRNINNATYTNATINSALNTTTYGGARFSLGLFFSSINGTLDIQRNASMSSWFDLQNANVNQVDISGQTAGINLKRASGSGNNANQTHIGTLNLKEGGRIRSVLILTGNNASIDTLNINGTIVGSNNFGGLNNQNGRINTINVAQGGNIQRGVRNSGTMQTLTISGGGQVQGGVNNSGTLTTLNLNNGGTINGGINNNRTMGSISVSDSTVNGGINNSNANSTLNNITVETGGNVNGGIHNGNTNSRINGNVTIKGNVTGKVTNAGTITNNITISDGGTIDASNVNDPQNAIDNSGTIQGKIEVVGQNSHLNKNIKNSGSINQGIEIKDNAVIVGVDNSGTVDSVKVENNANITGDIYNEKAIQNGIDITNSQIGGNIVNSGQNANTGNISITGTSDVGGSIVNQNGATFNNQITLEQGSKLGGISNNENSTMSGTLTLNGEVGTITNAGKFDSTLTLSNKVGEINNEESGTISKDITIQANGSVGAINNAGTMQSITNNGTLSNITNSGTMQAITNNATTGTLTLTNSGGTIDKITNGTGATATIRNQGKITNGIINDGGTLTVFNDFRKDESAANGYHTIGEIGKTANGVHIENNNNGKLHLDAWYFNKEDYATAEERKNNALLVNGNYAGITLGDVFVNTQGLDVDKTYNANTFIADKDGNAVGGQINNGQGIDVNKLHSVSGIYKFENFGGNGQYRAIINRDELSGKSLAQSIIYSQRVRNVNLSRILREATTQVFVSGKEGEVNGKSLSQLEQLHTNHRDENSQNHTFVIPYYQNFSADLGNNAKLKSNSSGMLIATQRELPNDYGVLGIYTGFENAEQKVNAQRLDLDGNSYYAGLTYNHSFYEDDLTTYFMNLTTKLDYIERDVTKTYLGYIGSVSSTAKVFGYGANARVG
ncbi:beta strand repeat-containing protein, partial [Campylobacter upsaliensis]